MDTNELRDHLTKLHEELRLAQRVDPRSNHLLGELMEDIKRLMERSSADLSPAGSNPATGAAAAAGLRPEPGVAADASLPDRLEKIAVQFEADHPTLAASSRRLVDLLGKVGI